MIEIRIGGLKNVIVGMFTVVQSIQTFEEEFEDSCQVFWTGCCDKDIAETIYNCAG